MWINNVKIKIQKNKLLWNNNKKRGMDTLYLRLVKPVTTFDEERRLAGSGTNIVLYLTAIFSRVGGLGEEESQRA